jgi:hypothetical protein
MDAGPAIALAVGIGTIYGAMVLAVIIGLIFAGREEGGH